MRSLFSKDDCFGTCWLLRSCRNWQLMQILCSPMTEDRGFTPVSICTRLLSISCSSRCLQKREHTQDMYILPWYLMYCINYLFQLFITLILWWTWSCESDRLIGVITSHGICSPGNAFSSILTWKVTNYCLWELSPSHHTGVFYHCCQS